MNLPARLVPIELLMLLLCSIFMADQPAWLILALEQHLMQSQKKEIILVGQLPLESGPPLMLYCPDCQTTAG